MIKESQEKKVGEERGLFNFKSFKAPFFLHVPLNGKKNYKLDSSTRAEVWKRGSELEKKPFR